MGQIGLAESTNTICENSSCGAIVQIVQTKLKGIHGDILVITAVGGSELVLGMIGHCTLLKCGKFNEGSSIFLQRKMRG
jgi:hypothetical protein